MTVPPDRAAPLRLVLVTHYFPSHGGGIERAAAGSAARLIESGSVTIEWFASDCDEAPASAVGLKLIPAPSWNGLEVRTGLPYPLWGMTAWRELWRSIKRCDVVHVHDYLYMGSLLAWAMAKLARRPVIVTQHVGNVPLRSSVLSRLLRLVNATAGVFVLRRTAATVFVSHHVMAQFGMDHHSRVHLITYGVDTNVFSPVDADQRAALRRRLGLPEGQPMVLFVGRFVAKKGLHLLRALCARMPQIGWVFAGRGPLDPGAWNDPHVKVFRDRSGASLADLYRAADLLVLPSAGEGFPLVIQEALACGTPVLSGPELQHALPGEEQILMTESIAGGDEAVMAWERRISVLTGDLGELGKRRAPAAAFAGESWSWPANTAAYLDLYRKVVV